MLVMELELPTPRTLVGLLLAAVLVTGCSPGPPSAEPAGPPDPARSAEERPTLPREPETRDPAALADQLDTVARILHDDEAGTSDVRRAGELHQLAIRVLADAGDGFRRSVTARLDRRTRVLIGGDVRAALSLRSLTDPEPRLPKWRIVRPPSPAALGRYYRAAERRTGVPWTYLAAIHLVETRMGRIRGTSTAGARGPMQFLPSTWDLYGAGGDIDDPRDAVLAAARLLRANGAPGDMAGALWHYNPSDHYVRAVTEHARTMQRSPVAYRSYWHWRVLYRHERGTYVLPVGYPRVEPELLERS